MDDSIDRLLRRKQIAALLGISRNTLLRIMQTDKTFPRVIKLSPGIEAIRERDIRAWLRCKELASRSAKLGA